MSNAATGHFVAFSESQIGANTALLVFSKARPHFPELFESLTRSTWFAPGFEVVEERGDAGEPRVLRTIGRAAGSGSTGCWRRPGGTATVRAAKRGGEVYHPGQGTFEQLLAGRAVVAGYATTWQGDPAHQRDLERDWTTDELLELQEHRLGTRRFLRAGGLREPHEATPLHLELRHRDGHITGLVVEDAALRHLPLTTQPGSVAKAGLGAREVAWNGSRIEPVVE